MNFGVSVILGLAITVTEEMKRLILDREGYNRIASAPIADAMILAA